MNILKKKYTINYHPKTKEELKALVDNESINLGEIDTSKITDMSELFRESTRENFTGIENWDVSNVKNMGGMLWGAESFNQDISNWDVSNVWNMKTMFSKAASFNQNIGKWDVSQVENMQGMFYKALNFNQDISSWDVSKVENMNEMFLGTKSFEQNLDKWNTENLKHKEDMFTDSPLEDNPPAWYKDK